MQDTICAAATVLSASSVGIIRVSGPDAIRIVDQIFVDPQKKHTLSTIESHTIRYGFLFNGEEILDEVLVSYFKAPKSFTAEDVVEINTHGGVYVMQKALSLTIEAGARLAEPGEFTKRAFLNGRIDLSEAEAVMDVISSSSDLALRSSVSVLRGSLYRKIKELREQLLLEIAFLEAALDDPEHYELDGFSERLSDTVSEVKKEVTALIDGFSQGRIVRDGIRTVILGKPNVGKSSLLNMLSGYDRAIVTDIPGTTRDIVEEKIRFGDVTLNIIDTAGIRDTKDVIEKIGIDKALSYAKDADLILYVIDSSVPLDENDRKIFPLLSEKKSVVLYNKSDLTAAVTMEELAGYLSENSVLSNGKLTNCNETSCIIRTSMKDETGMDELRDVIRELFFGGGIDFNQEIRISNLRHKEALSDALSSLSEVERSISANMPEDLYTVDLTNAYASLGKIIGESLEDDVVDKIFSEFCMGK